MLSLVSVGRSSGSWSTSSASSNPDSSRPAGRLGRSTLEPQCFSFLTHGLALSTCRSFALAQTKFISFCQQLGKLHSSGSPCPKDEWPLCLFVTFLARTLQHLSIKVHLSAIRALCIDQGFPDPLADSLRLQWVIHGIKHYQSTPSSTRLPITDDLMQIIWQSLDPGLPDHPMFWAACSLGYFGCRCASQFTVPNLSTFFSSLHLSSQDITGLFLCSIFHAHTDQGLQD